MFVEIEEDEGCLREREDLIEERIAGGRAIAKWGRGGCRETIEDHKSMLTYRRTDAEVRRIVIIIIVVL
jgi:hypothetical protein